MAEAEIQLNLELDIRFDANLSDFSGPGWYEAMDAVRQLHVGMIQHLYLFGSHGTGKSHLLSAICESFIDNNHTAINLSLSDLVKSHTNVNVLSSLESFDVIAIDDIDAILGNNEWQEAMFHLINHSKEFSNQLIFASSKPSGELMFSMRDLETRLSQFHSFRVPDGHNIEDREAMLKSILHRRGWQFHPHIIEHLLQEGPYRIGEMMHVLKYIQPMFANLSRKRITKTTINEANQIIDEQTLLAELEDINEISQADSEHMNDSPRFNFL